MLFNNTIMSSVCTTRSDLPNATMFADRLEHTTVQDASGPGQKHKITTRMPRCFIWRMACALWAEETARARQGTRCSA